jgi:hypothetical protein
MNPFIEVKADGDTDEDFFFIEVNEHRNISVKQLKKVERGAVASAEEKAVVSLERLTMPSLLTDIGRCIKRVSDTFTKSVFGILEI